MFLYTINLIFGSFVAFIRVWKIETFFVINFSQQIAAVIQVGRLYVSERVRVCDGRERGKKMKLFYIQSGCGYRVHLINRLQ